MLKTQSELARLKGVTRLVINRFIAKHGIPPAGQKGKYATYDTEAEPLATYLSAPVPAKAQKPPRSEPPVTDTPLRPLPSQAAEAAVRRIAKPLNNFIAGQAPRGGKPAEYLFSKALELAQKNQDASLYFKLGQIAAREENEETLQLQALKTEQAKEQIAQGRADRIQLENSIRRGEYMDKATVKVLFGRVYTVHTSILTPISLKLASTLAAIPDGEGKETAIKEIIDGEIYAALEMVKRQLIEYIEGESA